MSIVLVGYRGCGKTTIGRLLAERLSYSFVDTDELIVQRAGKSIKAIFAEDGEKVFRDLECMAVADVVARARHVVALGGGALGRDENRVAIRTADAPVVYLACEAGELHRRIHGDPKTAESRPNLTHLGGGLDEIKRLLQQREPVYRQMAMLTVDVTMLSAESAALRILADLRLKIPNLPKAT
jgi:shikimate kinase